MSASAYEMPDFPLGARVRFDSGPLRDITGVVIGYGTTSPGYVRVGYDYLPNEDRYASSTLVHSFYIERQA